MPRPVLFFAFANDRTDDESFLRNLTEEQKAIEAVLRPRQLRDWDVKFVPGVTVAEVFDVFQQPEIEGCITLLHFAGHADGEALVMERDGRQIEPAGKDGLAEFLGAQEGLRVVFLNACSTRKVAEAMIKQGVPAVIATSRAIDDEVACQFAVRFYTGLAGGRTVEESFNAAANEVRTWLGAAYEEVFRKDDDGMRFPGCETEIRILAQNHEWPWRLLTTEGTSGLHARQWSLALHDPLLGVPSLPPGLSAPSSDRSPFRVLAWFEASDARIFFGRGRDIRELWQAIENPSQGIVLLHGPSGSGKSSLLEAGLLPRLKKRADGGSHQIINLRRSKNAGLAGDLQAALQKLAGREGDVPTLWRALEENGAPLLAILDQAEESFTRPREDPEQEWRDLLSALAPLFGESAQLPRGKLLLSFRKEWYAEIEKRLRTLTASFGSQFLAPLERDGIIEVVEGAARDEALQAHYRHRIQPGLAGRIADDLLKDRDSAIAPMLEVLLFDLWQAAGAEAGRTKSAERDFTLALYEPLQRRGTSLRSFLSRQLDQAGAGMSEETRKRTCDSGLVLDVLAFHTTPLGTAERRNREELAAAYAHVDSALLDDLLTRLDALSLLAQPAGITDPAQRVTRLSHDSLAPLVREAFDNSELPGQRARRILDTRVRDAAAQADLPDNLDAAVADAQLAEWIQKNAGVTALDKLDYSTVCKGRQGMRQGGKSEAAVLKVSQVAEEKREQTERDRRASEESHQRWRKRAMAGALAALVIIAVLSVLAMRQANARVQEIVKQRALDIQQRSLESYASALRLVRENKEGEAAAYLLHALRIWPQNRLAADRLYGLMTQRSFALPRFGPVQGLSTIDDSSYNWPGDIELPFQLGVSETGTIRLLADGELAEFREVSEEEQVRHELISIIEAKGISAMRPSRRATLTADGRWLGDCKDNYGTSLLLVVDLDTGKIFQREVRGVVGDLEFIPSEGLLLALNAPDPHAAVPTSPSSPGKEEEKDDDDDAPDPQPDMTKLLVWRFSGSELSQSSLGLESAKVPEYPLAIHAYPDGKKVAVITGLTAGEEGRDRQTRIKVYELDPQKLDLHAIERLAPEPVDGLYIPAFSQDSSVMAFPTRDGASGIYLHPFEMEERGWESTPNWSQPAGFEWLSDERAYCWPGTNLHVLFGRDRIGLASMSTTSGQPEKPISFAAITPRMKAFGIGRSGTLFGSDRHPMPLDNLSEAIFNDYSIFDARCGVALPEIITTGRQERDVPYRAVASSRVVASFDSGRLTVVAHFRETAFDFVRAELQLQERGGKSFQIETDFGFMLDDHCVFAEFSPDGEVLAIVINGTSDSAALYIMDIGSRKLVVKGDGLRVYA